MLRKYKKLFAFIILCNCTLWSTPVHPKEKLSANIPDWLKRTDYGLIAETDQKPRFYFETVQPLYQTEDKQDTLFIQPRVSFQDEFFSSNLGVGYRKLLTDNSVLMGTNVFFDFEDEHKHYRTGVGFELYYKLIESRFNTYIGLSPRRLINKVGSQTEYEKAVDGLDWEIGGPVPYIRNTKLFAGGYWYNYEEFDNKHGWKVRAELIPIDFFIVNVTTFDDNKGDIAVNVDARVTLKFGGDAEDIGHKTIGLMDQAFESEVDHSDRTLDRVERNNDIEVERYVETVSATIEIKRGN